MEQEEKTLYPINYLGKTYNTTIHADMSDEEFLSIKENYYKKPNFEEVKKQLKKISEGGMRTDKIIGYYLKDLMARVRIHYNNWTIAEALEYKPLMEFFKGKTLVNEKVFPKTRPLWRNIEDAFRLCGFKTCSRPTNFPLKSADDILQKYNVNGNYYDFSCGWGIRLLSALRNKINYYGVDTNNTLVERLNAISDTYKEFVGNSSSVEIKCVGSEIFNEEWEGKMGLAFSSPPYFNLEYYEGENTSCKEDTRYEDWLNNYMKPTIANIYRYLINDGIFAININNFQKYNDYDLIGDTIKIAQENNFELIEVAELKNITRCSGHKEWKEGEKTLWHDNDEHIFIFKKKK